MTVKSNGIAHQKRNKERQQRLLYINDSFVLLLKWLEQELAAAARYDVRLNLALGSIEALELEHQS